MKIEERSKIVNPKIAYPFLSQKLGPPSCKEESNPLKEPTHFSKC